MSDKKKTEETEAEKTYSEAFEKFERDRGVDPSSHLFFDILDGLGPEVREQEAEKARKLMSVVDFFNKTMTDRVKTEEGRQAFVKELERRAGSKKD